jgi:hypothetical protein
VPQFVVDVADNNFLPRQGGIHVGDVVRKTLTSVFPPL